MGFESRQTEEAERIEFDAEVKKTLESVIDSNVHFVNLLEQRHNDRLNDLAPNIGTYVQALAAIRDNPVLNEELKENLDKMSNAMVDFGISYERQFNDDLENLTRLHDTLANVGEDLVVFGKQLQNTYAEKADPFVASLVQLINTLEYGAQRLTSRMANVRDYLDR